MEQIPYNELLEKYEQLKSDYDTLKIRYERLQKRVGISEVVSEESTSNKNFTKAEKLAIYLSLFRGRSDVVAKLWSSGKGYSPYCLNEWQIGVCPKKENTRFKCSKCHNQEFVKLDKMSIGKHLTGKCFLGIYPMTKDDKCYFVAIDLDKSDWRETAIAIIKVCVEDDISIYPEISKSGNGIHLWLFFEDAIKASLARTFASVILTKTMERNKNMGMDSYDRLFPSQDYLQKEGFGNLIALPLNYEYVKKDTNIFVDRDLKVIRDQWKYLSIVQKLSEKKLREYIKLNKLNDEEGKLDSPLLLNVGECTGPVNLELSTGIRIEKDQLSAKLLNYLRRISSFSNPEYFKKQKLRMSTYNTPKYIQVYVENERTLWVPRGTLESLEELLTTYQIEHIKKDERMVGELLNISFNGVLREDQEVSFRKMIANDIGVLCAPTGYGKTVIGSAIISERKVSAIVLVHTKQLANQWRDALDEFLDISEHIEELTSETKKKRKSKKIGLLGGGKNQLNGRVDVAIMQSMFTEKEVKSFIKNYGLVIVDECHHVSASTFNQILTEVKAKYVYGLTATPKRKDGHHPNIFMQCGPIRHNVDPKIEAEKRGFSHYIIPRFTSFRKPLTIIENDWHISAVYRALCEDENRNNLIVADVLDALNEERCPIILTQRVEHVTVLSEMISSHGISCICLTGKMTAKEREVAFNKMEDDSIKNVVVATGRLVGEGFDFPRLDTLFLAMPIAWKGTAIQYVGRLHRRFEGKEEVRVYDYIDIRVGLLENMYYKRLKGYKSVGYTVLTSMKSDSSDESFYELSKALDAIRIDIKNSEQSVIISMPKLKLRKIFEWKDVFHKAICSGVRVLVVTNEIDKGNQSESISFEQLLQFNNLDGLDFQIVEKRCLRAIVVDNKALWFGDVNPFWNNKSDAVMMRLRDGKVTDEILDILDNSMKDM